MPKVEIKMASKKGKQKKAIPTPKPRFRPGKYFSASLMLALQLGLFSAWTVFRGNHAEFNHGYLDLLPFFLLISSVLTGLFWGMVKIIPLQARTRVVALMTLVGVLIFLQSNVLIWDYGVFDGGNVPWERHQTKGWLELGLWVGLLSGVLFRPKALYKNSQFVCYLVIILQVSLLTATSFNGSMGPWHRDGSFATAPPPDIYKISKNQNVIHVLFDAFQTDVFEELVAEGNLSESLDGFVLFHDNLGVASLTSYCIPAIFSGEIFDGSENHDTYYQRCVNQNGFTNQLFDLGYKVNLMPHLPMDNSKYHNHFRIPNTFGGSRGSRQRQAAAQLLDVGWFRSSPHVVKRWLFNDGRWRFSSWFATPAAHRSIHHRAFLKDYIAKMDPVLEEPAYAFFHIMSPHPPFGILADGSPASKALPLTRENYKYEAQYSLQVFMEMIQKLKDLSIYDDAFIIIQGDHGIDFPPVIEGKTVDLPVGRGPTLVAVKRPQAKGSLHTSFAPTSISDLPSTVTDVLGMKRHYEGPSFFELSETEHRSRGFFQPLSNNRENPIIRRFKVDGSIFKPENWQPLGETEIARDMNHYQWGDMVEFGAGGNAGAYLGIGWSVPRSGSQWSDGNLVELHLQVKNPGEDVELLLAMWPYLVPGILEKQRIRILVNGQELTTITATNPNPKLYVNTIPREMIVSNEINITFQLPDATIPASITNSSEKRKLGISMASVCLFPQSLKEEIRRKKAAASAPKSK